MEFHALLSENKTLYVKPIGVSNTCFFISCYFPLSTLNYEPWYLFIHSELFERNNTRITVGKPASSDLLKNILFNWGV